MTDRRSLSANLTLTVTVSKSGRYQLSGIYNNPGDATSGVSCAIRSVYVDGADKGSLVFPEVYSDKKNQTSTHLTLDLEAGTHTFKIFYDTANWYDRNMSITNNNVEYNFFNFDYVGTSAPEPTEPETVPATEPPTVPATEPETEPAQTMLLGDADGDEEVSILDATVIQRYLADMEVISFYEIPADVDGDGEPSISDVTCIQRWLADIYVPYAVGEPIPV